MDTRQKLTLGIVAIFMVTLTIVGVTYAYFVTQVTTTQAAEIEASTATLSTIDYGDGNKIMKLENAIPGETAPKKTFTVTNNNTAQGVFSITLETSVPGSTKFVSASETDVANCYIEGASQETTACFTAGLYNNVYYRLYEVDSDTTDVTGKNPLNRDGSTYTLTDDVQGLNVARTDGTVQTILENETIDAGDTKYYVLEVIYADAGANQNIENLAALNIKVDIM